jgi:ribosomal protein S21
MAYNRNSNSEPIICTGNTVEIRDGKFEAGMRKFRNKVRDSGLLLDLRDRESYIKPTTRRKVKLASAKKRWKRTLLNDTMPKKLF